MKTLTSLMAWLLSAAGLCAQSAGGFDLTWSTVDGGGGTAAGGEFTLRGTIAQPDAAMAAGGGFTLEGGFWPGAIDEAQLPLPPALLQIAPVPPGRVTVSWPVELANWELEASADLAAQNWQNLGSSSDVQGAFRQMILPVDGGLRFFRLRSP
jgi:hypothetical protein